jgi:hypothetical protein
MIFAASRLVNLWRLSPLVALGPAGHELVLKLSAQAGLLLHPAQRQTRVRGIEKGPGGDRGFGRPLVRMLRPEERAVEGRLGVEARPCEHEEAILLFAQIAGSGLECLQGFGEVVGVQILQKGAEPVGPREPIPIFERLSKRSDRREVRLLGRGQREAAETEGGREGQHPQDDSSCIHSPPASSFQLAPPTTEKLEPPLPPGSGENRKGSKHRTGNAIFPPANSGRTRAE